MRSLEETPFTFITTEAAVRSLVADLLHCNVISVNVIQHSYRSYLGYASIIMVRLSSSFHQISSPFADYAIDAIQCHDCCWLLNEVFTAPQILKVMFDAEEKLLWLQRDFGVFMVNLFDIQVALALMEKKRSFGEVIESHMHVYVNMRYQRADWRWVSVGDFTQNAAADAGDAVVLATDDALLAGAGGRADGAAARSEQSAHQPSRFCCVMRARLSTRWRPATSSVWRHITSPCRRTRRARRRSPSSDWVD